VDAHPGDRATPPHGLALDMREVEPGLAAEEILAHVGDAALDVRLPGRVARDGRVDHEAADLRVFGKHALEDRIVAVGLRDRRLEIVELLCPRSICGPRYGEGPGAVSEGRAVDT